MPVPSESSSLPAGTHIGRTALSVSDLEATTDFYRTVVGLAVHERTESTSTLGAGDAPLLVLEHDPETPARQRSETGLYHTAFRLPSRGALGDALGRVRRRWQLDGASDHRVSEALYLTDPEGNGVELYRDFPRDTWPVTDDGMIGMTTEPLDLNGLEADATGNSQAPSGTDIGHVHLEVSSLETFEDYYVDALGFELQATLPAARFVSAGGYHHHVGANTWNDRTTPARGRGLSWFEVVVPDAGALDAVRTRLDERDISITEADEGFVVVDPDDIRLRFRAE